MRFWSKARAKRLPILLLAHICQIRGRRTACKGFGCSDAHFKAPRVKAISLSSSVSFPFSIFQLVLPFSTPQAS